MLIYVIESVKQLIIVIFGNIVIRDVRKRYNVWLISSHKLL